MKRWIVSLSLVFFYTVYAVVNAKTRSIAQSFPQNAGSGGNNPGPTSAPPAGQDHSGAASRYRDGEYTGPSEDAYYGMVQVKAVISGGRISDVQFLDYPHDHGESIDINTMAMPQLKKEAIMAQSADVDIVTRATDTSLAFRQSLAGALAQAQ